MSDNYSKEAEVIQNAIYFMLDMYESGIMNQGDYLSEKEQALAILDELGCSNEYLNSIGIDNLNPYLNAD